MRWILRSRVKLYCLGLKWPSCLRLHDNAIAIYGSEDLDCWRKMSSWRCRMRVLSVPSPNPADEASNVHNVGDDAAQQRAAHGFATSAVMRIASRSPACKNAQYSAHYKGYRCLMREVRERRIVESSRAGLATRDGKCHVILKAGHPCAHAATTTTTTTTQATICGAWRSFTSTFVFFVTSAAFIYKRIIDPRNNI